MARSIPAWAGEPTTGLTYVGSGPVYPRVGGGTLCGLETMVPAYHDVGVYPRVGGGTEVAVRGGRHVEGLSPRGRGNRGDGPDGPARARSIPAWAGEPLPDAPSVPSVPVYPRVGGGTSACAISLGASYGLSPRGRGNRIPAIRYLMGVRSIPAWAGEPHLSGLAPRRLQVYPRVGGGTRCGLPDHDVSRGLSPRGRGNPIPNGPSPFSKRSIPAWAGEPG